jgi:hypothetical protein
MVFRTCDIATHHCSRDEISPCLQYVNAKHSHVSERSFMENENDSHPGAQDSCVILEIEPRFGDAHDYCAFPGLDARKLQKSCPGRKKVAPAVGERR